jgi:DNA repair protein RadC
LPNKANVVFFVVANQIRILKCGDGKAMSLSDLASRVLEAYQDISTVQKISEAELAHLDYLGVAVLDMKAQAESNSKILAKRVEL